MPSTYHDEIDHIYDEKGVVCKCILFKDAEKPYYASPSKPHSIKGAKRPILLYLHGGGLNSGSIYSHQGLVAELAKRAGLRACMVEYRLAPENPYPAMLEDVLDVYKWLLQTEDANNLIIGGDSAGGLLTLWALLYTRDHGMKQVRGGYLISPVTDFSHDVSSYNFTGDLFFRPGSTLTLIQQIYGLPMNESQLGIKMGKTSKLSPLYANLKNLPPMYFQAGSSERLLDESVEFVKRAQQVGTKATVSVYKHQQHVFQSWFHFIPEADQALNDFVNWTKMIM